MQSVYAVQENLIECYLELCSYADVQSLLVRYDGYGQLYSVLLCITVDWGLLYSFS